MMNTPIFPLQPVVLIDDDPCMLESCGAILRRHGITHLIPCADPRQVEPLLASQEVAAVLLDLSMPHLSGEALLQRLAQKRPDIPVIIVTGVDETRVAVRCMKMGAFDYIVKPFDQDTLVTATRRAVDTYELRRENTLLKQHVLSRELRHPEAFSEILSRAPCMQDIFQYLEAIACSSQPVLITGETGVGKELAAKAVHTLSQRQGGFVAVNVAGLDGNVVSDTLFGHVRGAFTGADRNRMGLVERAAAGTLFLDEIGDLNPEAQVKLLRLVQEREFLPVGSDIPTQTNARIIVATNRHLERLLREGLFREDLYYRLHSHHVHIPPLRDRLEDLPLLADHFLEKAAREMGKRKPTPPPELYVLLKTYSFPGNVRELESMVLDAVSKHRTGVLSLEAFRQATGKSAPPLPDRTGDPDGPQRGTALPVAARDPLPTLKEANRMLVTEALHRTHGNQKMAAELLGITRQTVIRHLKQWREPTPPKSV